MKSRSIVPLRLAAAVGATLLFTALAGCASAPRNYAIRGEADPVVNRDAGGAPLSVVVRIYQLKAPGGFSKLTFDTLAFGRPEPELLGDDLLEKTELVLVPGAVHTTTEALREDTRYVGVVAFFRRPHAHYWRWLAEADAVRRDGLTFRAKDCYLVLVKPRPVPIPGQPDNAPLECETAESAPVAAGEAAAALPRPADKPANPPKNRAHTQKRPKPAVPPATMAQQPASPIPTARSTP